MWSRSEMTVNGKRLNLVTFSVSSLLFNKAWVVLHSFVIHCWAVWLKVGEEERNVLQQDLMSLFSWTCSIETSHATSHTAPVENYLRIREMKNSFTMIWTIKEQKENYSKTNVLSSCRHSLSPTRRIAENILINYFRLVPTCQQVWLLSFQLCSSNIYICHSPLSPTLLTPSLFSSVTNLHNWNLFAALMNIHLVTAISIEYGGSRSIFCGLRGITIKICVNRCHFNTTEDNFQM